MARPEPKGLPRSRLLAPLLSEAGPGVVVVIAPPGSGKTTLLSRAAALSPRPVAWHTARPEQRTGPALVAPLTRAAAHAVGRDLGDGQTAADLTARLAEAAQPLLLVLDDVHELQGSAAETELGELLRWRPQHVRIALGTRRPLATNAPRLMVSGELVELDSDELRFRSWEVEELFRSVYREPLSPEAAAALTRRTGGWAAGLMLFHLSTSGKSSIERERAVANLSGRSRLLRSYLTRTVLDELDPDRREFLLGTCTLGVLTGPLCDALLGREGSAAVLEELAARQFFTAIADDGRSYRYHQVLQNLLEGLLADELGSAVATRLYARSAALLEAQGLTREALRAFAMAEDFASVARLLQTSSHVIATDPWLGSGGSAADDPWLALVRARRLQRAGSTRAAVAAFRDAERLLDDSEFRRRCGEERAAAAVWLPDAVLPGQPGPGVRSVAYQIRVLTRRLPAADHPPEHPLAAGLALLLAGDAAAAARRLARAAAPAPAGERLFADLARVAAEIAAGEGSDTVSTLEEVVLTAELEEQPWVARVARGLQAAVLLVVSPEPWRADSCESLVEECVMSGDDWGAVLLAGALGTSLTLVGDPRAGPWLDRARQAAESLQATVLAAWAEAVAAVGARRLPMAGAGTTGSATTGVATRTERARALARAAGLGPLEPVVTALLAPRRPVALDRQTGARIRCLGAFRIETDGRAVDLPALRPLPRALLMLLSLHHARDVHREVLIDLLWPDTGVDLAAHRLHAAASSVRRSLAEAGLGEDVVRRNGRAYCLRLPGASLDVADFERGLREAARREAAGDREGSLQATRSSLDLYEGDLLVETGPAEWVVAERDRLRVAAASAAYTASRLTLGLRTASAALPLARRATDLDPLRDSAWALLAEVQERMGDVGAAAATRREHAVDGVTR